MVMQEEEVKNLNMLSNSMEKQKAKYTYGILERQF